MTGPSAVGTFFIEWSQKGPPATCTSAVHLSWAHPEQRDRGAKPVSSWLEWSIVHGPLPWAISFLGLAGLGYLILRRGKTWWLWRVLPVWLGVALVVGGTFVYIDYIAHLWADKTPRRAIFFIALGVFGLGLWVLNLIRTDLYRRIIASVAVIALVAGCATQFNIVFGTYQTVRTALGLPQPGEGSFDQVKKGANTVTVPPGKYLDDVWQAPAGLPPVGTLTTVQIPGAVSKFPARSARLWVPPAYYAHPQPKLPVLVLLAGQPGEPEQWITGGLITERMNDYAAVHDGLAPIVVMPDDLGPGGMDGSANPLCVDGPRGNADTYLSVDVPNWIKHNLQADTDTTHWAIGGLSHGGMCAMQMAVYHPKLYPTFVNMSGTNEPTLGYTDLTVRDFFGGDRAAFSAINPVEILRARKFPELLGVWVVGAQDNLFRWQMEHTLSVAKEAGVQTYRYLPPGEHNWSVWGPGLMLAMQQLAPRMGLIRP
ncbi:esterase [Pseudonocardiaceae bacterium YIM PH 21723]|nr:esterase [Pseudonocardiaceae bacterium YIM PH 21723]